jgi:hypothetical protein
MIQLLNDNLNLFSFLPILWDWENLIYGCGKFLFNDFLFRFQLWKIRGKFFPMKISWENLWIFL